MTRLVAANRVITADGREMKPGVVELDGERVVNVSALLDERPFTEWLGGTINLQYSADEQLRAYKDGEMLKEK
ncbi:hypothetical protein [uncultured Prevotella sp.]|uniref:hypothetical protein n=1 Tax=uncultured Prevotella sp. TaxID=159272 RepID=UPI00262CE11E|nr:hypothetical protein [uncultured Prevotella sp.]